MKIRPFIAFAILTIGCSSVYANDLESLLSGATMTNGRFELNVNPDGTLLGGPVVGTWEIVDGEWCRTLTAPEQVAGSECQSVTVDGQALTFTSPDGRSVEWTLVE